MQILKKITICQKVTTYIILSINLILNLLITIILLISSRNIKILNDLQKSYLVLAIILWLLISLKYFAKLLLLIYTQITKKRFYIPKIHNKFNLVWIISNGCALIFMLIGLIWDMVLIVSGDIANAIYVIIYFVICFIYIIFSILDFNYNEIILKLICKPILIKRNIPRKTREDNFSGNGTINEKENEGFTNEDNKTKIE